MKPVKSLAQLENLIKYKVDLYDLQGHKIDFVRYMYNRLYDIYMDIQNGNLFYNPIDLME